MVQDRRVDVPAPHISPILRSACPGVLYEKDGRASFLVEPPWQVPGVGQVGLAVWFVNEPNIHLPVFPGRAVGLQAQV